MEETKNTNSDGFKFVKVDQLASEKIDAPTYSYWRSVMRQFFSSKTAITMLIVMLVVLLMSFIQPMFSGYDFMDNTYVNDLTRRFNSPSLKFWFGTDGNGNSLFDAVWAGARTSISISVLATLINSVIGIIVGAIWGSSKKFDRIMLEVYNVVTNVPMLLIVIVLSYSLGSGFGNLLFAMTVTGWMGMAYFIRVQVMIRRDQEYNLASRTLGTPTGRLIFRNILPYLTSVIVTDISRSLPSYISYETFLSFLGVGLSADVPSLGRVISNYSANLSNKPYLFWIPVAVLAVVSISLYIVGQTLADATDPRTHQ
ncbi:oligopeptide ABC transporter permease OppC [Enterococcus nangangensis]|uniref:oligopeptide ABC transporter permease OppC n=1 Tax=Enterococcus nangangensis TaxID=2559926 RepID=UPI0010F9CE62|nr:oligopeptide ABC transporter permease OppC [Enterococcus nangangensis]